MKPALRRVYRCCLGRPGFTLVEVLVAALIIGVALIPVLSLFHAAAGHIAVAERETRAAFLAQARLEEVKDLDYSALESVPRAACPEDPAYDYTIAVESLGRAKKIAVTVYYPGAGGEERTVVLTTVRSAR